MNIRSKFSQISTLKCLMKTPRVVEYICKKFLPWFLWFHGAFWRISSLAICLLKEVFTKRKGKGSSAVVLTCLCFDMIFSSKNARLRRFLETFVYKRVSKGKQRCRTCLIRQLPSHCQFLQSKQENQRSNQNHLKNFQVLGHLWRILCD